MNYDISMVVPGLKFDGDTINKEGLGGSESAAYYMSLNLARLGHRVTVFSSVDEPSMTDNVQYMPFSQHRMYCATNPHDVMIVQRSPKAFSIRTNAKVNILWCHDLAHPQSAEVLRGVGWNIDRIFLLSDFMVDNYKKVYDLDDESLVKTSNGIDLSLFKDLGNIQRDKKKLIYAARPERGLDNLLHVIFPKLLEKDPDYKLYIAGYYNRVDHFNKFYDSLKLAKQKFGDAVIDLGALPKHELYKHYASAGAYVYPTPSPIMPEFNEVSCITAMECQAAGLPFISSHRGALSETLHKDAGLLIKESILSKSYVDHFVNDVIKVTTKNEIFDKMSKAGKRHAQTLDWIDVAQKWTRHIENIISINNNDDTRLLRHLYVHSDIIPAKELIEAGNFNNTTVANKIIQKINDDFDFMELPNGYQNQYEKIGATHNAEGAFNATPGEARFNWLVNYIRDRPGIKSVADYGCAHGSYAIHLHNAVNVSVDGVDIDKIGIKIAKELTLKHAIDKNKLTFRTIDKINDIKNKDCAVVFEVLEHVPEPWVIADQAESMIKDGGEVVITVPYGPWEYDSYETYPHRAHIWHLDKHDLFEMFKDKSNLAIGVITYGLSRRTKDPIGWLVVTYNKNGKPSYPINIDRHLKLQRPRQTVSANVIAGPGSEKQMKWSLDSYRDIFDELIVVDTGMNSEAIEIAKSFNAKIIKGADPKEFGFETPRNEGLKHCSMDWVMWIDTDEYVTDTQNLNKYMRDNMYMGYSLKQHHFSTDANFPPDVPVRFFRRKPYKGNTMRWIGMIHEHPELAMNEGPGPTIVITDSAIAHTGYLVESTRMSRFHRNYPLLQLDIEKYPDRLLQKYFIMRDEMLLVRDEMSANNQSITQSVIDRCNMVIEIYKKYFLGKIHYVGIESTQHYSDALAVLGKGIEVTHQFNFINKPNQEAEPIKHFRYESVDDFIIDYECRVRDATKNYTSNPQ